MLDGSSPKTGKIWSKVNLQFKFNDQAFTTLFLLCNMGHHKAILGIKWLDEHNPDIGWGLQILPFLQPEVATITHKEEADKNPLKGIPEKYH
ncbi:unnamed protein product, partial [Rhizoctonia solani]